jgi:hypothetical protein
VPDIVASFNLHGLDIAFLDDPYPTYRALRECDPIHRMPDGSYFLTRHADLVAVYRDAENWSSDKKIDFKPGNPSSRSTPLPIRLVVVSWPALSRKMQLCRAPAPKAGCRRCRRHPGRERRSIWD